MEYAFKVGGEQDPLHWQGGQLISKREDGYFEGGLGAGKWGKHRKGLCIIRDTEDFHTAEASEGVHFKEHLTVSHQQGFSGFSKSFSNGFKQSDHKYSWEVGYIEPDPVLNVKYPKREYFIDFKELLTLGHITQAQYDSIYDVNNDHLEINLLFALSSSGLIHHEKQFSRN